MKTTFKDVVEAAKGFNEAMREYHDQTGSSLTVDTSEGDYGTFITSIRMDKDDAAKALRAWADSGDLEDGLHPLIRSLAHRVAQTDVDVSEISDKLDKLIEQLTEIRDEFNDVEETI